MSKISVTTIAGLTSGGDANKVIIESGDTLQVDSNATVGGTLGVTGVSTLTGNVGIGNGTPSQLLSVGGSSSGTKVIQVTNSTAGTAFNKGMQMFINDTAGGLNLRENYPLQVYVNGAERARFLPAGGLTFNGDTAAANALDDYEEGQWTPNVYNTNYSSNWTTKKGDYIRVGRVVHCWFVCDHGNTNSGSGTGDLAIAGLPFNIASEATSGSTFAHNSTQSVGMWSANPSQQVGNLFNFGSAVTFKLYMGGANKTGQLTFVTGSFSYIAQ